MEFRRLGHSGLQVSVIGLGTNNFGRRLDYPAARLEDVLGRDLPWHRPMGGPHKHTGGDGME
jgi:hypothetical protein